MQPSGAFGLPSFCPKARVVAVNSLSSGVALGKPHHFTGAQVDGWENDEPVRHVRLISSLQLPGDLGAVNGIMADVMDGLSQDRNLAHLVMLSRSLPLLWS